MAITNVMLPVFEYILLVRMEGKNFFMSFEYFSKMDYFEILNIYSSPADQG
jgi:hypothetical protein